MCGIAGWISGNYSSLNDKYVLEAKYAIEKVIDLQHHRGPDARGFWASTDHRAFFGHNRLAIIDVTSGGAQPMVDTENDWAITYNGELYNYKALRSILEAKHSIKFRGNSDTEVFLYGVKVWGIDEFLRLADGMFAAALYCTKTGRCILVRDRAGEKPLYYAETSKGFYFGSELRPLSSGIGHGPPDIDLAAFSLYLMLRYVPAPLTIYKGIRKLRPGHFLVIDQDQPAREYAYFSWDPNASEIPETSKTFDQIVHITEKLLVSSLEHRMTSDVPLGFFLSGGVDSSLVAALARKHFGVSINTYTIGFENDPNSEHFVSQQTAKIIGSKHNAKILGIKDLGRLSRELIHRMDEPNGDRSCVPTYLLCKHARSEVTVALGGDGGDELFGGYQRYPELNTKIGEDRYPRALDGLLWYLTHRLPVVTPAKVSGLLSALPAETIEVLEDFAVPLYSPSRPEIDIRYVDFKSYLSGAVLAKVDRMSMQNSLEVRTPFLSPSMFDLANRLPHGFLYRGQLMKPVLRELCNRLGLAHVAKLDKRGFGMPPQFMELGKEELVRRASEALRVIDSKLGTQIDLGKLIYAVGLNANALWATIVLGEWLESERS